MKSSIHGENVSNTILNQVQEDMPVCDRAGDKIGKVRQVFLGAVSNKMDQRGAGPATASVPEQRDETLVDFVAEAFADKPLPDVLRERLLRQGFIQIDTSGLFASDRFAFADQIQSVMEDCVRLSVSKDELIER
jgi:hypothetical protein